MERTCGASVNVEGGEEEGWKAVLSFFSLYGNRIKNSCTYIHFEGAPPIKHCL